MEGKLMHQHIIKRLRAIHITGICVFVGLFILIFLLGYHNDIDTLMVQMILISMAGVLALSYVSLLFATSISFVPALTLVMLNVLNTVLVWATGILHSPFIIMYVILIIISTQLYSYKYGLLHILLAGLGYIMSYGATVNHILPYKSILPYAGINILFQPTSVILLYGLLYVVLLVFTVLSSTSARMMLYRPQQKVDLDTTYQEKIIQDMPLGVLILDSEMNILGQNPWASVHFPVHELPSNLEKYLVLHTKNLKTECKALSKSLKEQDALWKTEAGETMNVRISVRTLPGEKKENSTFIIFIA